MKIKNNCSRYLLILIVCFISPQFFSQKEANNWYFGNYAALNFSTTPPAILANSSMTVVEGCTSISDSAGSLMFYTDGETVWNRQHQVMSNGSGLIGGSTPCQSSIVIPDPAHINQYYLFNVSDHSFFPPYPAAGNFAYSIVDMSLAAGMGSVTVRDQTLSVMVTERIAATPHCNGSDTWIVVHEAGTANFLAYLMGAGGINPIPVVSNVGSLNTPSVTSIAGCMKISPEGKRLAVVTAVTAGKLELFDFDNSSGIISNPLTALTVTAGGLYGCEFSPDGSKLYANQYTSNPADIYQLDLCAGSPSAIVASSVIIGSSPAIKGSLQQAPDGKIYVARYQQHNLGVITNPNDPGLSCNYTDIGPSLGTGTCQLGLPTFDGRIFRPKSAAFTYSLVQGACATVTFVTPQPVQIGTVCTAASYSVVSSTWYFGDPASGTANTSTLVNPSHVFSSTGSYQVKLVLQYNCHVDTLVRSVTVSKNTPTLSVAGNFTVCAGASTTLTASGANTYMWSNSVTGPTIILTPSVNSVYTVTGSVTGNPCIAVKTITINFSSCLGLTTSEENDLIKIYPNPSSLSLFIETNSDMILSIYTISGEYVLGQTVMKGRNFIDIRSLKPGVYIVTGKGTTYNVSTRFFKIEE